MTHFSRSELNFLRAILQYDKSKNIRWNEVQAQITNFWGTLTGRTYITADSLSKEISPLSRRQEQNTLLAFGECSFLNVNRKIRGLPDRVGTKVKCISLNTLVTYVREYDKGRICNLLVLRYELLCTNPTVRTDYITYYRTKCIH